MSAIDETLERLQESVEQIGVAAARSLRTAVEMFNASPISLSSVDAFRERVLRVADHLDAPLPKAPRIPEPAVRHEFVYKGALSLGRRLREVPGTGESRRVD